MDFDFSDFVGIEFPRHKYIVYILFFSSDDDIEVPFYVGESSRGIGRFGDYISAKFSASTDFKVGEAVRYLQSHGFTVQIKYKESENRKGDEKNIISILQKETRLLNELEGYEYNTSNEENERKKIHHFLEKMIYEKGLRTA